MYDLSIIIPFFHKVKEFKYSLKQNYQELEKALEVIILIDHQEETQLLSYIQEYDNINFSFFINSENHPWRNPAVPINYGIKKAKGQYIMVISPESIFVNNVVDKLYLNCVKNNNDIFTYGNIIFTTKSYYQNEKNKNLFEGNTKVTENYIGPIGYGSICCSKQNFKDVGYYNEDYILWGGEDDNVRSKLINFGIDGKKITNSKMLHLETHEELKNRKNKIQNKNNIKNILKDYSNDQIIQILKKNNIILPKKNMEKNEIYEHLYTLYIKGKLSKFTISDFKKYKNFKFEPSISKDICKFWNKKKRKDLENFILNSNNAFEKCEIGKKFKNHNRIMLLTPCYNEENNIINFLKNNENFVDGCIILDDGSSDKTWKKIKSKYFSVKVKKKRGEIWDDLQNRNLLLSILNILLKLCVNIDYVLWLDCDEIIGNIDIKKVKSNLFASEYNVLNLPFYHMWGKTVYNLEYPKEIKHKNELKFILNSKYKTSNYYTRIFKVKKNYFEHKISFNKKLHFSLIPDIYKKEKIGFADLQILHFSTDSLKKRENKHAKYMENDKDISQENYDHILKKDPIVNKFTPIY